VANIDLAPTIAAVAGVPLPDADGRSLLPLLEGSADGWRRALLVEHMRGTNPIPTYCAIRTSRYLFVSYVTGERELYDLENDPFELANLARSAPERQARLEGVLERLCDPPPPGFHDQMGLAATLLAIGVLLVAAGAARSLVSRIERSPGVA
jgi:arylsulfatase A-like enzyme